jgi:hypothetical protein
LGNRLPPNILKIPSNDDLSKPFESILFPRYRGVTITWFVFLTCTAAIAVYDTAQIIHGSKATIASAITLIGTGAVGCFFFHLDRARAKEIKRQEMFVLMLKTGQSAALIEKLARKIYGLDEPSTVAGRLKALFVPQPYRNV